MIYRRLFHTRVSFFWWYIVNLMPIIREVFVKFCVSFVYRYFLIAWMLECRNCVGKCRLHFCVHSKKHVTLQYNFNNCHICVIDWGTIKNILFNDSSGARYIFSDLFINSFVCNCCISLVDGRLSSTRRIVNLAIVYCLFCVVIYNYFLFRIAYVFTHRIWCSCPL